MRKIFVFHLILIVMSFMGVASAFATDINSQSIDVTVGEVDTIGSGNEGQNIVVPDTGFFGLEPGSASVVVTVFLVMPMVAIVVWLSRFIYHKYKK